ncbi:unnamed protein product [Hermetia illucens]|uniref:Uncharacterized protein n=1 Tax=Hermetia illucens TaxID=343691 RepID=A0A7R8UJP3_HERIL|nr:unnamed protein product [Hermetia illucens]
MENLTAVQSNLGSKLEELLINFKQDPVPRKTREYFGKRLGLVEVYWSEFDRTHDQLNPFEETAPEHPHFANCYYEDVCKVYEKLILLLKDRNDKLEGTTSDDTMATSSNGKFKNTAGPNCSERHAEFELTGYNDALYSGH